GEELRHQIVDLVVLERFVAGGDKQRVGRLGLRTEPYRSFAQVTVDEGDNLGGERDMTDLSALAHDDEDVPALFSHQRRLPERDHLGATDTTPSDGGHQRQIPGWPGVVSALIRAGSLPQQPLKV